MHLPSKSYVTPIFLPFWERTYNGPGTDLQRTYCYGKNKADAIFFKELNAKHVHEGEFCMITHCVSKRL